MSMEEEGVSAATDHHIMISSFLEIAVGQTADTARQFLQATGWKLEEAIQLFYVGNDGGLGTHEMEKELVEKYTRQDDGDDVRAPLPVKRDVLYDNPILYSGSPRARDSSHATHSVVTFRNFEEEMKYPGVWEAEGASSSSAVNRTQDNLASLYRPPFALMFHGPFEKVSSCILYGIDPRNFESTEPSIGWMFTGMNSISAFIFCEKLFLFHRKHLAKDNARMQNKWLIVNMQSTKEFSSHTLNRETWANEAVAQTIKTNFIFWQVYDDTEEGSKVCTYYKLHSIPVILLIDPITGQKMHSWHGMVQPEKLLEDLLPFMDSNPSGHHVNLSHKRPREASRMPTPQLQCMAGFSISMENFEEIDAGGMKEGNEAKVKEPAYLPLPEEPKGERNLICRVGVRLPDGRRVQRNFLRTDPVQLLWSFCYSELKECGIRPFRLTQAIPGASRSLDFDADSTFQESGLANSMVSVTLEE
ncbi:hypothetical protein SASPL_140582 [Salvia splendens]|uniref:UBX domain-containing protein n=1 Tax=Salvia splendens TaxID=180675 RepID=A0A8X8WRY9_SALSN|nr:hypothetical protein SASPL_140582 [Salvia splendens]